MIYINSSFHPLCLSVAQDSLADWHSGIALEQKIEPSPQFRICLQFPSLHPCPSIRGKRVLTHTASGSSRHGTPMSRGSEAASRPSQRAEANSSKPSSRNWKSSSDSKTLHSYPCIPCLYIYIIYKTSTYIYIYIPDFHCDRARRAFSVSKTAPG